MAAVTRKSPATAQMRAAQKAEQVANLLHSFATALNDLDTPPVKNRSVTPRNWYKKQSGRFKNDPTFTDFVAQVQAARKQEG